MSTVEGEEEDGVEECVEEEVIETWMDDDITHGGEQDENEVKLMVAYADDTMEMAAQETVTATREEYTTQRGQLIDDTQNDSHIDGLNLPELLSRKVDFEEGVSITVCFSKKCSTQLAWSGYLFNQEGIDGCGMTTWSCVTPLCTASIKTSPQLTELTQRAQHAIYCRPDETQLRLRIAVYDLRLMAEFTDVHLNILHRNAAQKFASENPEDIASLFPSFEALGKSLFNHRRLKLFRRRFEANRMHSELKEGGDLDVDVEGIPMEERVVEESYAESVPLGDELAVPRLLPYGKPRGFPATFCVECGAEMGIRIASLSPQEALIQHVNRSHRPISTKHFVFESTTLEIWLREVQRSPAFRFRRFSLIGDSMYYLCGCDERLPTSKFTQKFHCTAFIRLENYRAVTSRIVRTAHIEYCMQHSCHDVSLLATSDSSMEKAETELDSLIPENFLTFLERRKRTTASLVRNNMQERKKIQRPPLIAPCRALSFKKGEELINVFSNSRQDQRQAAARQLAENGRKWESTSIRMVPRVGMINTRKKLTEKINFPTQELFDTVQQCETQCEMLVNRLQSVRDINVAKYYLECMTRVTLRALKDPLCQNANSATALWRGQGKEEEKSKNDDEEEEGDEEEDDDEEEQPGTSKRRKVEEKEIDESVKKKEVITLECVKEESKTGRISARTTNRSPRHKVNEEEKNEEIRRESQLFTSRAPSARVAARKLARET